MSLSSAKQEKAIQALKKRNKQIKSNWQEVHGLFLLNKPKDITSNLALQKVRRIFQAKKAGHTGSLDPMATGLLPCCFGDATKVAGLMLNADKVYQAECLIGSQTDTGDATGNITKTSDKIKLTETEIMSAISKLTGQIKQIPPMYSALHHKGKRLYEIARAGHVVERQARDVTIHSFELTDICQTEQQQFIQFEIKVSKGTYIRTLLEDFAKECGSYAHMTKLHRTQLGILTSDNMLTLEQLLEKKEPLKLLQSMDTALIEYPQIKLQTEQIQTLIHGLQLKLSLPIQTYRIYDSSHQFVGLGTALESGNFKVKNLFLKSYKNH